MIRWLTVLAGLLLAPVAGAELPMMTVTGDPGSGESYSLTIQALALMTVLTLLPAAVLAMTSFTRIIIVLSILRQALGTAQTPPNQVLLGLTLFLTAFIMTPTISAVNADAVQPYLEGTLPADQAIKAAMAPMRQFMLSQTRESDLALFVSLAGDTQYDSPADVPNSLLVPSFMISELKTAFQIGFLVFVPFLVIDLVVSSVLMSMGMMMLSPMLISLPFKLMLFVLVDGWALLLGTLASSFYV